MAGKGGYQRPSNPAPVSGPGAGSKRTDGGPAQKLRDLPDAAYGEAATFRDQQTSAPLAQTPSTGVPAGGAGSAPMGAGSPPPGGFGDPTAYPNEPVTAGNPTGPGPGPEVLGQRPNPEQQDFARLRPLLPALEVMASLPTTSTATRNLIRYMRGASS